jgi:hypothetical protein
MTANELITRLSRKRFRLDNEKDLQREIFDSILEFMDPGYTKREYPLDDGSIIDIFVWPDIGIEIKLKGSKREIYRQIKRYCECPDIKNIILITNLSIGLPPEINGKGCWVMKPGKAWL